MSRIGKLPIKLIDGAQASIENDFVTIKGPKGELKQQIINLIKVEVNEDVINVAIANSKDKRAKAMWGLMRTLISNMVIGVTKGHEKKLEVNGIGYKVSQVGNNVVLNVGYSHPVKFDLPEGISAKVDGNIITIEGIDKQLVGEVSAQIRKVRKPEPYKGKGIKYIDEVIIRKAGKTASKGE